ncbi:TonB-dependent receptor plug domain-containing protein [Sphingomonas immobilis]|uniref:TonB-dependent receptor n=1 Tax=Sphingomonas immobilis TaxID=3063997 RepID=A0ABT9A117_9SPHN|nr:TonB-dependent receptor [Sphingomonas sp. CA1-15]MDO7843064.1 TonB-dependent receptor [Sphingomonas sp. CA1-15]
MNTSSTAFITGIAGRKARQHWLGTVGIVALATFAQPVFAAAPPAAAAAAADDAAVLQAPEPEKESEEILVTGSRIVRDGYSAPTPVSVISTKELKAEAPANISDFVNTLPAVRGSGTASNSNGSLSNGAAGINSVNLRNLGANRTLVLFDGQRSVASTATGQVDVNTFPQALIERVEVVTGGASSAYGSDAVSGVVNFILNKKFKGLDASVETGVTTYGDAANYKFSVTAGKTFFDDKLRITLSGEYFKQNGVTTIDRDWNNTGFFLVNNPAYSTAAGGSCAKPAGYVAGTPITGCAPEYFITSGAGTGTFSAGGLITGATTTAGTAASGAALAAVRGEYFGPGGAVSRLTFGPSSGQWMIGGDYKIASAGHASSASLQPSETRKSAFGRLSYEVAPALEVYGQFAFNEYRGQSFYQQTPTTGVNIAIDNAYLPQVVRDQMTANGLRSIAIGTSNVDLGQQGSDNTRSVYRYVAGLNGTFGLAGIDWKYDAYYQFGMTKTVEKLTNAWNLARMTLATDAVFAPAGNALGVAAGTVVCRSSLTNPTNGCVPLNRLGTGVASQAAINYVLYNGLQPTREQRITQKVAAASFSTNNLFQLPAGGVSLAFGGEWREEGISGTVDPLFQPVVTGGVTAGTWIYGNYLATNGKYNVKEAFAEVLVPVIKGADLNGAIRVTDYSTSGTVVTWKAGATWQIIPDLKFRGTVSRDIRAPNLQELFAAGTGRTNTVNRPNGAAVITDQFNESTVGNTALKPEVAQTYGVGAVLTPRWLPGFALSVDYYNIDLSGAISSLTAQTLVDQCYTANITAACTFISTTGGRGVVTPGLAITSIEIKPTNFVSVRTQGIDFEGSYRHPLGPGAITLRALASWAMNLSTDNGVVAVTDDAGQNTGGLPSWTYRFSAGYDVGGFATQFIARGVSGGVYNNNYVVCTTNCPASTTDFHTVNLNSIPGAFYFDANANYTIKTGSGQFEVFMAIKNIFDRDPVLVANGPTGNNTPAYPQTNRALYDVLGRTFRVGVRVKM